jgi:pimeloyl-ACP methyl ester carboxylesterase
MAAERPAAVRSVITWGSAGSLGDKPEMADDMATVIDNPIPPMCEFSEYMKAAYGEDNGRIMTQSAAKSFRTIMEAGGNISRSRAASIACPALLIGGENDFMATPALVTDMAGAIPQGEYLQAKGAGHQVHLEQPEWLVEAVVKWLSKLPRA